MVKPYEQAGGERCPMQLPSSLSPNNQASALPPPIPLKVREARSLPPPVGREAPVPECSKTLPGPAEPHPPSLLGTPTCTMTVKKTTTIVVATK